MVQILYRQQRDQDNHQHMFHRLLSEVLRQQSQRHRQLPIRGLDYFSEFYNGFMMGYWRTGPRGIRPTGNQAPLYFKNYKTLCLSNDSSDSLDSCFALIAVLNMVFIISKSSVAYNLKSKKSNFAQL